LAYRKFRERKKTFNGLVLLWRQGNRSTAAVCLAVTAAFFIVDSGYWIPFGGTSPRPRFFAPALPFLALGLPTAFHRWPRFTFVVATYSVTATARVKVKWSGVPRLLLAAVLQQLVHGLLLAGSLLALTTA
jgi:hypothetical protein